MILKVQRLSDKAVIPEIQTEGSAGYDLCACTDEIIRIKPGEAELIKTGIAVEIPEGCAGMVFSRSGMGVKHGIHLANAVGVIDSDYRGELMAALRNSGKEDYEIHPGDRIAQLIIMPVFTPRIEEAVQLSETERGMKGFGSTGK